MSFGTRFALAGFALALVAAPPFAFAQKTYRCSDGKGGTTFQQSPCPETAQEAEARQKEKERLQAEAQKKKEDEARKKEEQAQKAKERDKAYEMQLEQKAAERRKSEEAERQIMQGAGQGAAALPTAVEKDPSGLPVEIAQMYPAAWREGATEAVKTALKNNNIKGCEQSKTKYPASTGGPVLVRCTAGGPKPSHYYVFPQTGGVTPAAF